MCTNDLIVLHVLGMLKKKKKKKTERGRPSEHPPIKTFYVLFYFYFHFLVELVSYQTNPKAIDSSRPLLSQVTPGRDAPIDCSLPLYYKLFPVAVMLGANRFTDLGISLPISSIHGYVTLSLNGRFYSLGMQVSYQTCPRAISLHPPKWSCFSCLGIPVTLYHP